MLRQHYREWIDARNADNRRPYRLCQQARKRPKDLQALLSPCFQSLALFFRERTYEDCRFLEDYHSLSHTSYPEDALSRLGCMPGGNFAGANFLERNGEVRR